MHPEILIAHPASNSDSRLGHTSFCADFVDFFALFKPYFGVSGSTAAALCIRSYYCTYFFLSHFVLRYPVAKKTQNYE